MADVLVSESFFLDVYRLAVLLDGQLDGRLEEIRRRLEAQVNEKIEAQMRRVLFTDYDTATKRSEKRERERLYYEERAKIIQERRSKLKQPISPLYDPPKDTFV